MLVIWTGNEQVQVNLAAMLQYDLRESYTMIRYLIDNCETHDARSQT